MMSRCYLLLWLEGPLQSWGFDSKFDRRDTLDFPTKSGILGMIFCAMGLKGRQRALLQRLSPLAHKIVSFAPQNGSYQTQRSPQQHVLQDFHMVGSGYDEHQIWENLQIPKTVAGSKPVGGGSKLTYRYYLQDAYFAAVIEVPHDLAGIIANALTNPVWDIYLGRKNCIPTDFVYRGCFDNEQETTDKAFTIAETKSLQQLFQVWEGVHDGEVITLNDVPVQFGVHKAYRDRFVTVIRS